MHNLHSDMNINIFEINMFKGEQRQFSYIYALHKYKKMFLFTYIKILFLQTILEYFNENTCVWKNMLNII